MKIKRKMLIASFFAALMLILPFTGVAENVETFGSKHATTESEESLEFVQRDDQPGVVKAIYLMGESYIKYLIEYLREKVEDFGYNAEMLEIEIENLLANEELGSMSLTGATSEYSSGGFSSGSGCGTTGYGEEEIGSEVLKETTSEDMCNEINMEAEGVSEELEYVETGEDIYVYLGGDVFETDDSNLIRDRLGWINGIIEFNDLRAELRAYIDEALIPNVTWVEVIEETLAYIGTNFDVEEFLFGPFQNFLISLADNLTSNFPIIHDIILNRIPMFVQSLYAILNQKVGSNIRSLWKDIRETLKTFIFSFFTIKGGVAPFKAFRRLLRATLKFGLSVGIMIVYMNETQIQEYKENLGESIDNLYNTWVNFFNWLATEPWLEPVNIKGDVTGIEPNGGLWVYCEKDPDEGKITSPDGHFEDLSYITGDEIRPWGIHKCVTTSVNNDTGESQTVGNSGNKIYDLILTGVFSSGNLTLTIDFSTGDNNEYVQSQNNIIATQKQQGSVEAPQLRRIHSINNIIISLNKHIK